MFCPRPAGVDDRSAERGLSAGIDMINFPGAVFDDQLNGLDLLNGFSRLHLAYHIDGSGRAVTLGGDGTNLVTLNWAIRLIAQCVARLELIIRHVMLTITGKLIIGAGVIARLQGVVEVAYRRFRAVQAALK